MRIVDIRERSVGVSRYRDPHIPSGGLRASAQDIITGDGSNLDPLPHGGHLFSLHLAPALGLGGAEINPLAFHPFHGPPSALPVGAGRIHLPDIPGVGFELHNDAWRAFQVLTTPPG